MGKDRTLEIIKTEIERRRLHFNKEAEKYQAINNGYSQNCYGARDALRDLENFLSALESEKPMNSDEELDQEIIKCWQEWVSPSNKQSVEGVLPLSEFAFYARHFAKWGAEHLKK